MTFTFLLGMAAGALTPLVEPNVRKAMEGLALARIEVRQTEMDLLTLILLLLLASLLTGGGSSFALLLGALLGTFAKRILDAIQGNGGGA